MDGVQHGVGMQGVIGQIARYMDLLSARQQLVISNLANIDTPGYRSKDIDFQAELRKSIQGEGPQATFQPVAHALDTPDLVTKSDGNNVSLDRETRLLAENALRFSVASTLMKAQLKTIESAIKEGPA